VSFKDRDVRLHYLNQGVMTASREKLLLLTYEIAVRGCRNGVQAIEASDFERANGELQTAEMAIRELQFALRPEKAEELADSLNRLYDFMHEELVQANIAKDPERVERVGSMLEELAEAWEGALAAVHEEGTLTAEEERMLTSSVAATSGGLDISF